RARHYATGAVIDLHCQAGCIARVTPADSSISPNEEAGWVAPSLFDLQINGCHGHSFNSDRLGEAHIREVVAVCRAHGVVSFCPTLVTNSFDALRHGLATIRQACESDRPLAHAMPAIHLEGPYLSPEDGPRGAHPREHIRPPDWGE